MTGVDCRMDLYALGAEELEADGLGAEVCDGFFGVLTAASGVGEVAVHGLEREQSPFHSYLLL